MKKIATTFFAIILLSCTVSFGATYYVSFSTGLDTYSGTSLGLPFKTITKAVSVAVAGDIIYLRGETHTYTSKISISKSGTAVNRISLIAYPLDANRPILNFSSMSISSGNRGIELSGNYWYMKGFDIFKAGDNGMHISGAFNIIDFCAFYENGDTGLQLANGANNNQIINCDSYYNIDVSEGNADGFAAKLDVGTGNSFRGCRAWQNSDDGWDGLLSSGIGTNPATTYDSCWCFLNGYRKNMTASAGNGNGFKMGGNNELHDATLRNCLAVYNRVKGFDQNNNNGSMILYNCTGYKNGPNFGMSSNDPSAGKVAIVRNCVSYSNRTGTDAFRSVVTRSNNSWQVPSYTVTDNDFLSVDTSVLRGPRNTDGSLPNINFMKLKQGSSLINAGTNVGLPFNGSAPDIGYWESNYPAPVEMPEFSASVKDNLVTLRWKTAVEINNKGWEVERYIPGSIAWQKLGFVNGYGTTAVAQQYSFPDNNAINAPVVQYRLKQIDNDGTYRYSNTITVKLKAEATALSNFPNPAKNNTSISFNTNTAAKVQLEVYNTAGKLVQQLINQNMAAGFHLVTLNTSTYSAGEYILKLVVNNEVFTRTIVKVQ